MGKWNRECAYILEEEKQEKKTLPECRDRMELGELANSFKSFPFL